MLDGLSALAAYRNAQSLSLSPGGDAAFPSTFSTGNTVTPISAPRPVDIVAVREWDFLSNHGLELCLAEDGLSRGSIRVSNELAQAFANAYHVGSAHELVHHKILAQLQGAYAVGILAPQAFVERELSHKYDGHRTAA